MKKIIAFILALMMILSVSVVSFATILDWDKDLITPCLGVWLCKAENGIYTLSIGYSGTYDMYIVEMTNVTDSSSYIKQVSNSVYSLTYDKGDDIFYLSNDANSVSYKMKLENDKITLTYLGLNQSTTYEKIQ